MHKTSPTGVFPQTYMLPERCFLKEYPQAHGTLKLFFDPIMGLSGILDCDHKKTNFSFRDIVGIPRELQFNLTILPKYLSETYALVRLNEEGVPGTIVINQQVRGGGNRFSRHDQHSQSQHYQSPPPPNRFVVSYNAGYIIRKVTKEGSDGHFEEERGGVGQTTYQVTFVTYSQQRPTLTIHVWKRDRYQDIIARHTNTLNGLLAKKKSSQEVKRFLSEHQDKVSLQKDKITDHTSNQYELFVKPDKQYEQVFSDLDSKIQSLSGNIENVKMRIQQAGPDIRNLIHVIIVIQQLGIAVLNAPHPILDAFNKRDTSLDRLIGEDACSKGILGTIANDLTKIMNQCPKIPQDILAIVGNTGAGKSTMINDLYGLKMVSRIEGRNKQVVVAEEHVEIAKIGHRKATSETSFTQVFHKKELPMGLADCGGYLDTGGTNSELLVATSLMSTFAKSNSVRLFLAFSCASLSNRATPFLSSLKITLKGLFKDFRKHPNSFAVIFTKPSTNGFSNEPLTSAVAREILKEIEDATEEGLDKEIYKLVMREAGKYVLVYDPLNPDSRNEAWDLAQSLTPITEPAHAFQVPCSDRAHEAIFNEILRVANLANELFDQFKIFQNEMSFLKKEQADLIQKRESLQKQRISAEQTLKQLEDELTHLTNSQPNLVQRLKEVEEEVRTLDQEIQAKQKDIQSLNTEEVIVYRGSHTLEQQS